MSSLSTIPCPVSRKLNAGLLVSLSVTSPRTGKTLVFSVGIIDYLGRTIRDRIWAASAHGQTASFTPDELKHILNIHTVYTAPRRPVTGSCGTPADITRNNYRGYGALTGGSH